MPSQKPLNFESPAPRPIHRGTMDHSRDRHADLPIEDWRSSLMEKKIDLYNFEGCAAEESSYILTSPRSLRACARMKIQPVELLAKPETDFEEELLTAGQQPGEASRKLYDAHERARLRKLYMCRRAREEIIQEDGGDERIEVIDSAKLLFQGMNKPPERTLKHTANGIDHSRVIIPKSGQGNSNLRPGASPRPPSHPPTRPPHSRSSATSKTSSTSSPRTPSTSSPRTPSSKTRSSGSTPSSTGGRRNPNPGDLPPRLLKRSASMPPTSRQRPQSAVSSGSSHRSSSRTPLSQRLVLDGSERPSRSSSRSRPYSANLPERDQRILDCMVFKREQERDELRHQRVASKVWDEERRKEEKIRMENELQRRKNLVERELDRQKKRERMQKQRDKEEKEKLKEFEMSLKYKDAKHVQMASQQDLLKIQQIDIKKQAEKTKKEKQAKALQEKEAKDEEYRRMAEKHSVLSLESAEAKRENKQQEEELQRKNKEVMQQHAVRKKVIDKKTEEENEYQRMCIDAKDSKHKEMIEQQQFQRQTELRNSRRKLEQQQKKASKTKVVLDTNLEKWKDDIVKHRTVVQEQAVVKAEKVVQEKAQKAQELRIVKEKTHKERIARVAEDAEALARYTEQKIKHKDLKVEGVIAKKQQEIDKSRAVAQNSAKLREQIRNQYTKSFDCMAKKAELESKLGAGPSLGTKNYSHVIIS